MAMTFEHCWCTGIMHGVMRSQLICMVRFWLDRAIIWSRLHCWRFSHRYSTISDFYENSPYYNMFNCFSILGETILPSTVQSIVSLVAPILPHPSPFPRTPGHSFQARSFLVSSSPAGSCKQMNQAPHQDRG